MSFYVTAYIDGLVPTEELPPGLEGEPARRALGDDLVDALVEIHAADVTAPGLAAFARPGSYCERQVRRFSQLWEINRTREVPRVEEVGAWLAEHIPEPAPETVVHGDFRLGNTLVASGEPSRILAVLDWEMGAIGDPRADVGYLLATYSEPGGPGEPSRHVADHRAPGISVPCGARRALCREEWEGRGAAAVVRGARALEGGGLLRDDLRPLRARRARGRGRASCQLRAVRPVSRGGRSRCALPARTRSAAA